MNNVSLKTPQEAILQWEAELPDHPYLMQPINRELKPYTWAEICDQARRIAQALKNQGLEPGDKVGIVSKNCAEWIIADIAIMFGGFIGVPIYPTANAETISFILEHGECKAVFVGKLDDWQSQSEGISNIISISFPYETMATTHQWQNLVEQTERLESVHIPALDDIMTLLYTSGSTGNPKGAVHNYRSFAFLGDSVTEKLGLRAGDRFLSYLPLSHCTERGYVEASTVYAGNTQVFFTENLATFFEDLKAARPTLFGSVPRLWKRFQIGVLEKTPPKKLDLLLRLPIIGGMVKNKVKTGLGLDAARWFGSGSAPIAPSLLEWWEKLDVPIAEGWGMTETFAYGTQVGPGESIRIGTISKALPGVELKIAENDELLVKSPTMMLEYYKDPEKTAEAFRDGYFCTGDCGAIDSDGYVRITGRAKEIFKTAKGKYVAPVPIESLVAENAHIEMVCVIGLGLTQPAALVVLAETADGIDRDVISDDLQDTLGQVNSKLESHERLNRMIVIGDEWTIDNGMLTPTLKVKRNEVEKRYEDVIQDESRKGVIWV